MRKCGNGHAMTKANTSTLPSGKQRCKKCSAAAQRRYRAPLKETNARLRREKFDSLRAKGLSDEYIAWLAGVFEGEGTVTLLRNYPRPYTHLIVSVTSTDRQMVEGFQLTWPVPSLAYKAGTKTAKPAWTWRTSNMKAAAFLTDILPKVRTARVREKIALALESHNARVMGRGAKGYHQMQQRYAERMRELNRRGQCPHKRKKP